MTMKSLVHGMKVGIRLKNGKIVRGVVEWCERKHNLVWVKVGTRCWWRKPRDLVRVKE